MHTAIVIGGGNIFRGVEGMELGIDRATGASIKHHPLQTLQISLSPHPLRFPYILPYRLFLIFYKGLLQ